HVPGPLGRTRSIVDPAGVASWFCYDVDGNQTDAVVDPNPVDCATLGVPDGTTQHTHTVFDLLGRATDTYDPAGVRATTSFDPAGRVVSETRAVGTGDETTTSFGYDPLGRRVTTSTQAGARDGQGVAEFSGVTERRSYSDAGRLEWICVPPADENPAGGFAMTSDCSGAGERKTTHAYDPAGRLEKTTDPTGAETIQTYNAAGQVETVSGSGVAQSVTYGYDPLGR
ncbi:MAG: RHS repeat protein, partial [Desulfobulbaceae bacterium]|nr:RHS repeat protein [Desulfobulbaceae bacterium]